jgi:hypothetical protein
LIGLYLLSPPTLGYGGDVQHVDITVPTHLPHLCVLSEQHPAVLGWPTRSLRVYVRDLYLFAGITCHLNMHI